MKSIKEKAEESSLGYDEVQAPAIGRGVVLGANYVLKQIEEMLALKNQYTSKCDFCDDLEWRIEQLKK